MNSIYIVMQNLDNDRTKIIACFKNESDAIQLCNDAIGKDFWVREYNLFENPVIFHKSPFGFAIEG